MRALGSRDPATFCYDVGEGGCPWPEDTCDHDARQAGRSGPLAEITDRAVGRSEFVAPSSRAGSGDRQHHLREPAGHRSAPAREPGIRPVGERSQRRRHVTGRRASPGTQNAGRRQRWHRLGPVVGIRPAAVTAYVHRHGRALDPLADDVECGRQPARGRGQPKPRPPGLRPLPSFKSRRTRAPVDCWLIRCRLSRAPC